MGGSSISTIPQIKTYVDTGDEGWNNETATDYEGTYAPSIKASLSFLLGAATVEYVMPLLQDLELSSGALFGLGRVGIGLEQKSGENIRWNNTFSNVYGEFVEGVLYYAVPTSFDPNDPITPLPVPGLLREVGATFFNFQPYVAIKWQLLDRVGLRISAGFNKGTIGQGRWKLNSRYLIGDSEEYTLQGVSFRTMLYLGL